MSETRITGDLARYWARCVRAMNTAGPDSIALEGLARQLDADARRLADLEAENGRLRDVNRELGEWRSAYDSDELAALRADAEEWRAAQRLLDAAEAYRPARVYYDPNGWGIRIVRAPSHPDNMHVCAPTPSALLAKLDALAEAAKPKHWSWRWRRSDGQMGSVLYPSPDDCRDGNSGEPGQPMREVKNADGDILLLAEGRPVPTEGGPWT